MFIAVISATCYSSLTILIKLAYQYNLSVITIVVLRMLFASAFLWLAMLLFKRENWRVSREHWLTLFAGVVLTFSCSQLDYFTGLRTVPAGMQAF